MKTGKEIYEEIHACNVEIEELEIVIEMIIEKNHELENNGGKILYGNVYQMLSDRLNYVRKRVKEYYELEYVNNDDLGNF